MICLIAYASGRWAILFDRWIVTCLVNCKLIFERSPQSIDFWLLQNGSMVEIKKIVLLHLIAKQYYLQALRFLIPLVSCCVYWESLFLQLRGHGPRPPWTVARSSGASLPLPGGARTRTSSNIIASSRFDPPCCNPSLPHVELMLNSSQGTHD